MSIFMGLAGWGTIYILGGGSPPIKV